MRHFNETPYVVFDVESVGLFGDPFAFAAAAYTHSGNLIEELCVRIDPDLVEGSDSDRDWVRDNVSFFDDAIQVATPQDLQDRFWDFWKKYREHGFLLAADVAWPVEANFLLKETKARNDNRAFGPYPLIDISAMLYASHINPVGSYARLENELPNHNPMADVRHSARLLFLAIERLTLAQAFMPKETN